MRVQKELLMMVQLKRVAQQNHLANPSLHQNHHPNLVDCTIFGNSPEGFESFHRAIKQWNLRRRANSVTPRDHTGLKPPA